MIGRVCMFCQKCGAQLEEGAVFCQNCGAKVEGKDISNPVMPAAAERKQGKKGILIAAGIIIIAIAAAVLVKGRDEDEAAAEKEEANEIQGEQDETISSGSDLEAEVAAEIENEVYEVTPGYTYESDQSNEEIGDFRLYMNLTFNGDDSISVFGWGYENEVLSENCFVEETVRWLESDEYTDAYVSDDGDFYLYQSLEYGYFTAMSDDNYFTGDFYLVTE